MLQQQQYSTEIFPGSIVRDQDPRKTLQVMMDGVVTSLFFLPRQPFINSKDLIQTTGSLRKQCQSLGGCLCDQADVYVSVGLPATCLCTAALDHDLMISFVLLKG